MTSPAKRKGDAAELEVQELLRTLLGVPARRMLGAGRADDVGDIAGVPTWNANAWENGVAAPPAPVHTLYPAGTGYEHPFHPPWINLWDTAQLSVELDYGRSAAYCNSHGNAGLQTKGSYP